MGILKRAMSIITSGLRAHHSMNVSPPCRDDIAQEFSSPRFFLRFCFPLNVSFKYFFDRYSKTLFLPGSTPGIEKLTNEQAGIFKPRFFF
jgi:hypothetical protein